MKLFKLFDGMPRVAAQKQWKLDPPDPGALDSIAFQRVTLVGSEGGNPVHFESAPSLYKYMTTASLQPSIPWTFVITHQGLGGELANLIGFHDIEIGDKEFDKTFRIVSKEVDRTKALLTAKVQTQLKHLAVAAKSFGSGFEVTEHAVRFTRGMLFVDLNTEEAVLRDLPIVLGVVRALQEAAAGQR